MEERKAKAYEEVSTSPKQHQREKSLKLSHELSNTNVHFSDYIKNEWKNGKRLPISIRINSELYSEFKPISKALYGSTCRAVEVLMASIVLAARQNVHFSNTKIDIGEINISRDLRPRRALPVQMVEETEIVKTETLCKTWKVSSFVDYSEYSFERLQHAYNFAVRSRNHVKQMMISAELQKRGFKPKPLEVLKNGS